MYAAIDALSGHDAFATVAVCEALEVSRSAYYAWHGETATARETQDMELIPLVRALFWKHRRRYGARRIASDLADLDEPCSPRRVSRLLKSQGLKAIQPKSFVPKTTASRHRLGYSPNLLLESADPAGLNQLWVGDITYAPLRGGRFCYLATLMDRYSRCVVGWELQDTMTEELVIPVLRTALRTRQPPTGLIHHTNRGGQYASDRYRAILRRATICQSMSRTDNCYDNAFMESCFGTVKTELEMTEYENQRTAQIELAEYFDYYNRERKHSALGYLSPQQFERLHKKRS